MTAFVKAAELGSFSAAGEALNMSSQLVGRHIQALEQRLGMRLLNRTTRRQSLTDFGREFLERARGILAEIDIVENMADEARAVPTGTIRINAPVSFGMHTLSPRLPEYMARHPKVQIELSLSNRAVDLINEGYDAVFRIGDLPDSRLGARALAPYELVLCAAPAYLAKTREPAHPLELQQHNCLGFTHPALRNHWRFEGNGGVVVVPVEGQFIADHGEVLRDAALAGIGIILQPMELVRDALADGRLVRLLCAYRTPSRPMHILFAADRRITPKLRSFLDFAGQAFGPN